jgi:WD40 repeat protein
MPSYWLASGVGEPDPLRVLAGTETGIGEEPTAPVSFDVPTDAWVFALSYSPNGSLLAAGFGEGGCARVYNTGTWDVVSTFTPLPNDCYFLKFSPDGTQLAVTYGSSSGANSLIVYSTADWSVLTEKAASVGQFVNVEFLADSSRLLVAVRDNDDKRLAVFNTSDWTEVTVAQPGIRGFEGPIAISPDGTKAYIVSGNFGLRGIYEYDTSDWTFTQVGSVAWNPWSAFFLDAGGARLAFGGPGVFGVVGQEVGWEVYNTSTWAIDTTYALEPLIAGTNIDVNGAAISPDRRIIALALSKSPKVFFVDTITWTEVPYSGPTVPDNEALIFAFSTAAPNSGPASLVVTTGTTGVVTTDLGAPAAGRPVRVYDRTTGGLITSTVTDAEGKFTTSDLGDPTEIQVVLLDTSTPALNDLIYRITL